MFAGIDQEECTPVKPKRTRILCKTPEKTAAPMNIVVGSSLVAKIAVGTSSVADAEIDEMLQSGMQAPTTREYASFSRSKKLKAQKQGMVTKKPASKRAKRSSAKKLA